jgi:hypothetical protein
MVSPSGVRRKAVTKDVKYGGSAGGCATCVLAAFAMLILLMITLLLGVAQALTIDGDESDWVGLVDAVCIDDPAGDVGSALGYYSTGYDLTKLCGIYDNTSDTLYIKINTRSTPGDADGDGNPNATSDSNKATLDALEVGFGEHYSIFIDIDGDNSNGPGYELTYVSNVVSLYTFNSGSGRGSEVSGTGKASIGRYPYKNTVVELSFSPLGLGEGNNLSIFAHAGSQYDQLSEDTTSRVPLKEALVSGGGDTAHSPDQPVYSPLTEHTPPADQGEEKQTPGFEAACAFLVFFAVVPFLRKKLQ